MNRAGWLFLLLGLNVAAAESAPGSALGNAPAGAVIDFQAQAQRSAPNDLGNASMYVEANGVQPAELARRVNQTIAAALAAAKAHPDVKVKSGGVHTYPSYGKVSRVIESWRMRSELLLESRDAAALSEAIGKLQGSLVVGSINFSPAPETRRKVEDDTTLDALAIFQEKAARYATALKKSYRLRSMSISSQGAVSPAPTFRAMAMASDSVAMPAEAGDSQIVVIVSGQIELLTSETSATISKQ